MTKILIPDLGGADGAQVIELLVSVGDEVQADEALLTLEGDKATMEVPAPAAGKITAVHIKVGDTVKTDDLCFDIAELGSAAKTSKELDAPTAAEPVASSSQDILVPDLGGAASAQVIEVLVTAGDSIELDQALITLEGDKATMEVPAPIAGKITAVSVNVGDQVSTGSVIAQVTVEQAVAIAAAPAAPAQNKPTAAAPIATVDNVLKPKSSAMVYASPSVRRYAAYYGVDLSRVQGSGSNGRVIKSDVTAAIIALIAQAQSGEIQTKSISDAITVDANKLGDFTAQELSKIKQVSGKFLTSSWQHIPHVTQQDHADVTDLESYRRELKANGKKVSPLIFIMKAVANVLSGHPEFNSTLSSDGRELYLKKAIHIGVAVDTPKGLVVPVIKNVNEKSLIELTQEVVEIAEKARTKGLTPSEMQGGGFTISSLGGIGGSYFTPIINAPEVAILGVSKLSTTPLWKDGSWEPRQTLPLSLSYDHRVIDGAQGARFITDLVSCLQQPKQACFEVKE